jgi:hypothetical protein
MLAMILQVEEDTKIVSCPLLRPWKMLEESAWIMMSRGSMMVSRGYRKKTAWGTKESNPPYSNQLGIKEIARPD